MKTENETMPQQTTVNNIEEMVCPIHEVTADMVLNHAFKKNSNGLASLFLCVSSENTQSCTALLSDELASTWKESGSLAQEGNFKDIRYQTRILGDGKMLFYDINLQKLGKTTPKVRVSYLRTLKPDEGETKVPHLHDAIFSPPNGHTLITGPLVETGQYLQSGSLMKNGGYGLNAEDLIRMKRLSENTGPLLSEDPQAQYHLLESDEIVLKDSVRFIFYEIMLDDVSSLFASGIDFSGIQNLYQNLCQAADQKVHTIWHEEEVDHRIKVLPRVGLSLQEIETLFPLRHLQTYEDNQLASFFLEDHHYVVIPGIYNQKIPEHMFASGTNLMYRPVVAKCSLDGNFLSGFSPKTADIAFSHPTIERLMVKVDGEYQMLGVPSVYEIGTNSARWLYKIGEDVLAVELAIGFNLPVMIMKVKSLRRKFYDFRGQEKLFTDSENLVSLAIKNNTVTYQPENDDYEIDVICSAGKAAFVPDAASKEEGFWYEVRNAREFSRIFKLRQPGIPLPAIGDLNLNRLKNSFYDELEEMTGHFHVRSNDRGVMAFNDVVWWYAHQSLLDYLHLNKDKFDLGEMEKWYSTAEFLRTFGHYQALKDLLNKLYTALVNVQTNDIISIIWPLKALCAYLEDTGDVSFLDHELPIVSGSTTLRIPVHDFIQKQLQDLNGFYQRYAEELLHHDAQIHEGYLANVISSQSMFSLLIETLDQFSRLTKNLGEENYLKKLGKLMKNTYYQAFIHPKEPQGAFTAFEHNRYLWLCHQGMVNDLCGHTPQKLSPTKRFLGKVNELGWGIRKNSTLLCDKSWLKLDLLASLEEGPKVLEELLALNPIPYANDYPGIYLSIIIRKFLGVGHFQEGLRLKPIIPKVLDGLRLHFEIDEHGYDITCRILGNRANLTKMILNSKPADVGQFLKACDNQLQIPEPFLGQNNDIYLEIE